MSAGHITIRLCCIPPPHAAESTHSLPSAAAPTGTTQASSEPPPAVLAWHRLAGYVRLFPLATCLLCLPQCRPASRGGPIGNRCGRACSREGMGSPLKREGGGGWLEEEVRKWEEGACAVREEGEWMVVLACEDTCGGIPPEELWGLLDPHGLACHSSHNMHGNGHHKIMVAEMRGAMAVLSDASTCTTILLALPLGGGEDTSSSRGAGQEGSGEEFDESEEAGEEHVGRESGLQGGMEGPAGAAVQPTSPPKRPAAGARALVRARTCPQAEMEQAGMGREGVEEAEHVVRGVVAGRWVAVVDDNAVNRMVVCRMLQGYGAHVQLLPSGEEALQALSSALEAPQ
ncbi:unnamed protein product [Closterium sp. NIES-54]